MKLPMAELRASRALDSHTRENTSLSGASSFDQHFR